MSGVNKVILIGRLGKDPEVRHNDSGTIVANFPIATSETYKDAKGEKKETTDWHNIVMWNQIAEIAEKYLKKGSLVYLEGKLKTRSWEKDGVTRYMTEVICNNMQMLGTKDGESNQQSSTPKTFLGKDSPSGEKEIDDLPF